MQSKFWARVGAFIAILPLQAAPQAFAGNEVSTSTRSLKDEISALDMAAAQSDPSTSIEHGRALLARAETASDLDNLAKAHLLLFLGTGYFTNNQGEEALANFERARDLFIAEGLDGSDELAEVNSYIGSTYAELGRFDEAREIKTALLERQKSRNGELSPEYADILYGLGFLDYRTGNFEGALAHIGRAASIMRALPMDGEPDPNAAIYEMSEAAVLARLGRVEDGLAAARQASVWADTHLGPDSLVTGAAANNYGGLLNAAGRYREAEAVLRRSLEIKRKVIGEAHPDTAIAINALAFSLEKLGETEGAESLYLESARIFEQNPDLSAPSQGTRVLLNAATLAFDRGDYAAALERRERALKTIALAVGDDNPETADARLHLGESYYQARRYSDAVEQLAKASQLFGMSVDASQKYRVRSEVMYGLALMKTGEGRNGFAIASKAYQAVSDRMEQIAAQDKEIIKAENDYRETLGLYAALAVETNHKELAFAALQLANYGELDRSVRALASRRSAKDPVAAASLRAIQDLRSENAVLEAALSNAIASGERQSINEAETRIAQKRYALQSLEIRFAREFPELAQYAHSPIVSLEEARQSLLRDDALLLVQPTSFGIVTLAITNQGIAAQTSDLTSLGGRQFVDSIRESIDLAMLIPDGQSPFPLSAAHELYEAIFPTRIAKAIESKNRLQIMASSYLASLPFSLLVTDAPTTNDLSDAPWLIRKFAISTPLSLRAMNDEEPSHRAAIRFAGIGAPSLAPAPAEPTTLAGYLRGPRSLTVGDVRNFPSLPAAEGELHQLSQAFAGQQNLVITGGQATEEFVKTARLSDYSVLAFATHGLKGSEVVGLAEPALVLTPGQGGQADDDGLLTASEIEKLHLEAEWVILSACNTAAGSDTGASPFSGLASAFVYAGARSLLLSHWTVRDDAAAVLSVQTVQTSAKGMTRAEALRQAQLSMIDHANLKDASHPAVWAPFVLIGE